MKINQIIPTLLIVLFVIFSHESKSQGFLHANGKNIVNGDGENVILRGIGTGNWMLMEGYMMKTEGVAGTQHEFRAKLEELIGVEKTNQFFDTWLNNHFTRADVDSMKAWGFNSVRVAMHYNLFTLPVEEEPIPGNNTWLLKGFKMIDNLLDWCEANEMYLILDLHGAPGGQGSNADISDYNPSKPSLWESQSNKNKTVALWKQLAQRYSNEPWIGGYDLVNETNWTFPEGNNSQMRELFGQITDAIREVDQNHIIFIEGNSFANDHSGLTPPWDDNMVYSFHKYWSYNNKISIQWMLDIRENYNIPIWCGESGENSNAWYTDAIRLLEDYNIGWAWWPLKKIESISGPLSINKPDGYQRLLDYWEGNASNPGVVYSINALSELAENAKLENCTYHKDVIDAMIRQPYTDKTIPFKQNNIPGTLFASNYDMGKNGYAYMDMSFADYHVSSGEYTDWNTGWSYRNDGVDIEPCEDSELSNGYNVGWTEQNEWLIYTVNATQSDSYAVNLRVASNTGTSFVRLFTDGLISIPNTFISSTGGWQDWETFSLGKIYLSSGNHELRLLIVDGSININYLDFEGMNTEGSEDDYTSKTIHLFQNRPNPVINSSRIEFWIKEPVKVTLSLFNTLGQKVRILYSGTPTENLNFVNLYKEELASGVYIMQLKSKNHQSTRKLIILD